MSFSRRVFRWLLAVYPRDFRARFADEMVTCLENRLAVIRRRPAGASRVLRLGTFWTRTILEIGLFAGLEHAEDVVARGRGAKRGIRRTLAMQSTAGRGLLAGAARGLTRKPAFAALAIATLAVGIGANAAIVSLVDTVLLRPLPWHDADRIVRVWLADSDEGERFLDATFAEFEALRDARRSFTGWTATSVAPRDLHDEVGRPVSLDIGRVARDFLAVLGTHPVLGRDFLPEEVEAGAPVVLLAHGFWRSRYAGDPEVLGRRLWIQGTPHTVVGVLPATVRIPDDVALWRPFTVEENLDDDRELQVLGRLRAGIGVGAATAEVANVASSDDRSGVTDAWVEPLLSTMVRPVRTPLWLLLGAVAALLGIAAANVAILQLSRGAERSREWALRAALGAGRRRLLAETLAENLFLAACGGLLGLGLGSVLLDGILRVSPITLPRLAEVRLDFRVALSMLLVTSVVGLVAGLVPALRAGRTVPARALRPNLRGSGPVSSRAQQAFVVVQVALATVLLVGSLLFTGTFLHALDVDRGFETRNLLTVAPSPPADRDTAEQRAAFYDEVLEALASLPGVESAALTNFLPVEAGGFRLPFGAGPAPAGEGGAGTEPPPHRALLRTVSSEFFDTTGIDVVAGRTFAAADRYGVAVVDREFERTFLEGDAVGKVLHHPTFFRGLPSEVVVLGVVEGVLPAGSDSEARPRIYLPHDQFPWPRMRVILRFEGDGAALAAGVRDRIWQIDDTIPLEELRTLEEAIVESVAREQFLMRLLGAFAAVALTLAGLGVFGVASTLVAVRRTEIGIRRALGADDSSVLRMVFGTGLRLAVVGIALGLGASALATPLVEGLVVGIRPTDARVLATAVVGLGTLVIGACLIPARRALRVDPVHELGGN